MQLLVNLAFRSLFSYAVQCWNCFICIIPKLYRLALWQGYRLYLQQFPTISLESIKDVEHFKETYFSDGLDTKRAPLTVRNTFACVSFSFQSFVSYFIDNIWSAWLLASSSSGWMSMHLLFGERERWTAIRKWCAEDAEHPWISTDSDAGCSALWKPMLDIVQWYFDNTSKCLGTFKWINCDSLFF